MSRRQRHLPLIGSPENIELLRAALTRSGVQMGTVLEARRVNGQYLQLQLAELDSEGRYVIDYRGRGDTMATYTRRVHIPKGHPWQGAAAARRAR